MTILPYALLICLGAVTISMLLCLIRLVMGPSIVDRLLALDTLFLNATCLVVILGIYWSSTFMFEGALLVAMLGLFLPLPLPAISPLDMSSTRSFKCL